jgi:hypothetical protein
VGGIGSHSYHVHVVRTTWASYNARAARVEVILGSLQQTELLIRDGDADGYKDEESCSLRRSVISAREVQDAAASRAAASAAIPRMVFIPQHEKDNPVPVLAKCTTCILQLHVFRTVKPVMAAKKLLHSLWEWPRGWRKIGVP